MNLTYWLPTLVVLGVCSVLQAQTPQQPDSSLTLPQKDSLTQQDANRIPIFTLTAEDLDAETESQDVSALLQSSRDAYTAAAGFNFGSARYRIRGLNSDNMLISINGVLVNDFETGWATWSKWAGLNDVTRYMEVRTGIQATPYNFGGLGGYSNIDGRAGNFRKGSRVSYALSNRAYNNRIMLTHSTGMQDNGWAFTASLSARWADEGYVPGTYFSAAGYFLAVEKKLNSRHSLNFTGFGAPIVQGRQGLAIQEAYDLTGSNYYNPFWGYQNGEKRNSRVSSTHEPMALLSHYFTPNEKTQVATTVFYSFGRSGITAINWYDAPDPRPDYYRYLPSFYAETDPAEANRVAQLWQTDESYRQLNWDQLYFANSKNLFTVENANGIEGNQVTGNRAKYILEEQRTDLSLAGVNAVVTHRITDTKTLTGGINIHRHVSHFYKVIDDLLGSDFWLDVDQFAERDFSGTDLAQSDLNNPNRLVYEGDEFGYDYDLRLAKNNAWIQMQWQRKSADFYVGLTADNTSFFRRGYYLKGLFPDNSDGDSETRSFTTGGLKAGATYKLSGRHYFSVNALAQTRAPILRNAFVSARTRHDFVPGLSAERVYGADLNYNIRLRTVKGRASVYYNRVNDQVWNRSFYHDEFRTFVNYTMSGLDQQFMGAELGLEIKVSPTVTATVAGGHGDFRYVSRPVATVSRDNSSEILAENRTVYLENYRVGGMPQSAGTIGVKYSSPKYWFAGVNLNGFANIYLDPNPDRRTEEALANYVADDPQVAELLEQTQLSNQFTVDAFAGKSWRLRKGYLGLNLNVSNLLNNQDFVIGGFEQLRYDRTDVDRFPPRLTYLFGLNFFAMVNYRF